MPPTFKDLREFITFLEDRGELQRITAPVDPELEITEITDRVTKAGGPALLFENVQGSDMPLLINTFGSEQRTAWALGSDSWAELPQKLENLLGIALGGPPEGLAAKLQAGGELLKLARIAPKEVNAAPCQEVVLTGDDVDLGMLPIIKCWPLDAGKYITLPLVCSYDPNTGKRNVGCYRMQVLSKNTTAMHWQRHIRAAASTTTTARAEEGTAATGGGAWRGTGGGLLRHRPAAARDRRIPLRRILAGRIRWSLSKARPSTSWCPPTARSCSRATLSRGEYATEGPFGDHTGYYSTADQYPVFHITAITHRRDPIYVTIIVGRPPMERHLHGQSHRAASSCRSSR